MKDIQKEMTEGKSTKIANVNEKECVQNTENKTQLKKVIILIKTNDKNGFSLKDFSKYRKNGN